MRSRYYDAILSGLDREVQPQLTSDRARFIFGAARRILASLAVANEHAPGLPENLAILYPGGAERLAEVPDGAALHAAVAHEGEILDQIEESVRRRLQPRVAATTGEAPALRAVTAGEVESYLRSRVDSSIRVTDLRVLAGGRSKQTVLVTYADPSGTAVERVIRRDLVVGITGSTVLDEYSVLLVLADRGYRVPRPLLCEADPAALGSAFMLMEKVDGKLAGDVFDAPPLPAQMLASARELARLHAFKCEDLAPTLRADRRAAPTAQEIGEEVARLEETWRSNARGRSATMIAAFDWLHGHVSSLRPITVVVHGDYSYHNLLFRGPELSAVMDWELVRIGHPAEDLGYIRAAIPGRADWSRFMDEYRMAGGPSISDREMTFFTLLAKIRLMSLLFKARSYFESGLTDDLQLADVCVYHMSRLLYQMSVEVRAAVTDSR